MNLFKRITQYKLFRRILLLNIMLLTFALALVSSILYNLFSKSAAEEVSNNALVKLMQVSYTADIIHNNVTSIGNQIINDANAIVYLYSKEPNKVNDYNAYTFLNRIQNTYPFIISIGLYNTENGRHIDTQDIPIEMEVLENNYENYLNYLTRKVTIERPRGNESFEVLTFLLYPEVSYLEKPRVVIVINIDKEYLLNTVMEINTEYHESNIFVMNSLGTVITHSSQPVFSENSNYFDCISKILSENKENGKFTYSINNRDYLITYARASSLNWFFVSMIPNNKLLKNILQMKNITFLVTSLLLLIGIALAVWFSGIIYNPLETLIKTIEGSNRGMEKAKKYLDEYNLLLEAFSRYQESTSTMQASIYSSYNEVRDKYILNLVKGNLSKIRITCGMQDDIERSLEAPFYGTLIFKIDNYRELKNEASIKDLQLVRFAICNISQELLAKEFQNDAVVLEEDKIVTLARLQSQNWPDTIYLAIKEIQDALRKYFSITLSASIGSITGAADNINTSLRKSLELIQYTVFYGKESIIDEEKASSNLNFSYRYSDKIESGLIEAIKLGREKHFKKYISAFINEISKLPYSQAMNYLNHLLLSIIKSIGNIIKIEENEYRYFYEIMNQINQSESLTNIHNKIYEFCCNMNILLNDKNSIAASRKYEHLIQMAKDYVEKNYSNPGLSIETVSEWVNLSSGYLGKIFKSMTNSSFNDYLNQVRLEASKALIARENKSISAICKEVGIYNVTYFSTLFKKYYGITPSQFRETIYSTQLQNFKGTEASDNQNPEKE